MVLSTLAEAHQINMCTALKELCHSVDMPVAAPIQLATRTVSKTHNFTVSPSEFQPFHATVYIP